MRTTIIKSISLPASLAKIATKEAHRLDMTESEFFRAVLRRHLETKDALKAIEEYKKEKREGKLKTLPPGGLARLIRKRA